MPQAADTIAQRGRYIPGTLKTPSPEGLSWVSLPVDSVASRRPAADNALGTPPPSYGVLTERLR